MRLTMDTTEKPRFFSTFIFPFKYQKQHHREELNPKDLAEHLEEYSWKSKLFKIEDHYSEWHYFHPFVREMIFHTEAGSSKMQYLTRSDCVEINVVYSPTKGDKESDICMNISSVDLHLFENQVGILSFTATMPLDANYSEDELLIFNDITRRLYPPFLGSKMNSESAKAVRVIPASVSLKIAKGKPIDEKYDDTIPGVENLSKIIKYMLEGMTFRTTQEAQGEWLFESFTDDRMFVVSYMTNSTLAKRLGKQTRGRFAYETDDFWYRYIFVDGGKKTIRNNEMQVQLIRDHTYGRWASSDTLFGISHYSFVCLCSNKMHELLYDHMTSMYYQLALIVLFQRSMLLKFSHDVRELDLGRPEKSFLAKAIALHGDFIRFTNAYLFSEVTPQEQGIELYDQWYKIQDLDKLFSEVKQEIDDVASYVRNQISHETDASVRDLTLILFVLTIWLVLFGDFLFHGEFVKWVNEAWNSHLINVVMSFIMIGILIVISVPLIPRLFDAVKSAFTQFRSKFK